MIFKVEENDAMTFVVKTLHFRPSAAASGHTTTADRGFRQTNGKKQHAAAESRFGESGAPAQLAADTPDFESPQDEIVVDTTGTAASPAAQEDESMTDAMASPVSHYPKRKRNSVFPDLSENRLDQAMASSRDPTPSIGPAKAVTSAAPKPGRVSVGDSKGVLVGWWRNSLVPDDGKKHAVIAFIDVRDRLRTRIQSVDRDGNAIPDIYALDPGPGNCWVTFDKVAFSDHLVGLDSFAVKEYVRLRAAQRDDSDEDRTKNEENAAAVALEKAKAFYDANERSDLPAKATQIAYGAQIPEAQTSSTRTESKRRKISGIFTSETPTSTRRDRTSGATERLTDSNKTSVALDPLYGTRPTSILLGHWRHSQKDGEPCGPDESHAIYGILGVNDMFRVKMLRETKSGVPFVGNFPQGAGSLWVNYDEVEFEDHLKGLTRNDIKEYCRVRQFQIDQGEEPEDKTANETRAVLDGQARAAIMYASKGLVSGALHNESAPEDILEDNDQPLSPSMPSTRSSRRHEFRRESKSAQHTHTHPEPEATPRVLRRHQGEGGQARFSSMSEREISRGEAHQTRLGRHAATRERAALAAAAEAEAEVANATANAAASSSRDSTEHGASRLGASAQIARLNGSWARREAQRLRSGADDAKVYDGIKYEWRTAGPFVGKLVSHGTLINIDGEDYVEYRILTKPSFF